MLQPMVPMVIVHPASADSVVSFVIADSNQIGFCFHLVGLMCGILHIYAGTSYGL